MPIPGVKPVAALVAALALGPLAGCSSGSSSSAPATAAPSTTGTSTTRSSATGSSATGSSASGASSAVTAPAPPPAGDYCAAARRFAAIDLAAARQPQQLERAFTELDVVLPAMQAAAPASLRAELAALVTGYGKVRDAAKADGWQWPTMAGAVMALGDDKAFTAAGDAVDAYDKATCGVVPVGAAPSTTAG